MEKIYCNDKAFEQKLSRLYQRPSYPPEIETSVNAIISEVRNNGDAALCACAKRFDHADLTPETLAVSGEEIKKASRKLSNACKHAVKEALANIELFSQQRLPQPWSCSPRPGVIVGERFEPMERIGVYIPGGTAPLVSTVIHTAGLAKTAGVREIVAVTPPGPDGNVHPAVIYAMRHAGVTEIYRLGGVYGIAALAYGTESVRKVEKIVGPGNAYVTAAKKLVYGQVAIDMVAGPSEIMIIADDKCNPEFIAADMLSQAEHGSGFEQAVLLSTTASLIDEVEKELLRQKALLARTETIDKVLANGVFLIQVNDLLQAAEIAGRYAPEHLEIQCRKAGHIAKQVKAAGAIFIGQWTPEPIGDFCAGPSHVLPTAGSGKFFSGLTVESFFRRTSIINYQKSALKKELETALKFAEMEGLDAHGKSAAIRFEKEKLS
ncbi:MAG: histidinol dehydrogenase [Victivallales bacterium]|nr:histidinol dehydrogenase [Victivallales bacterium]